MSNIIIGNNNKIDEGVIIHDHVVIGNDNVIKSGTIIFSHTTIGDRNIILESNKLGILPVLADQEYKNVKRNGLVIGDDNFFHIENKISSGFYQITKIGDHNKFLSEVHISHDNQVHSHVTFYPRVFTAGLAELFDYSNLGAGVHVQQRVKVGSYSMLGMNGAITKNVLPFMICINNKYIRPNSKQFKNIDFERLEINRNQFDYLINKMMDYLNDHPSKFDSKDIRHLIENQSTTLKYIFELVI